MTEDLHCQQTELYRAERSAPSGRQFHSVEEMQRYVDQLRESPYWRAYYPNVKRIEVYARPANRNESVGWFEPEKEAGAVEMLPAHWTELVLLHEVAHVLAGARFGSQAHCPWFARVYLELVYHFHSAGVDALHEAFESHGIEHDPPTDTNPHEYHPIPLGGATHA